MFSVDQYAKSPCLAPERKTCSAEELDNVVDRLSQMPAADAIELIHAVMELRPPTSKATSDREESKEKNMLIIDQKQFSLMKILPINRHS